MQIVGRRKKANVQVAGKRMGMFRSGLNRAGVKYMPVQRSLKHYFAGYAQSSPAKKRKA